MSHSSHRPSKLARLGTVAALSVVGSVGVQTPVHAEEMPPELMQMLPEMSKTWGTDPAIVAAVKEQNAKGLTLSDIQSLDAKWQATSGLASFMLAYFDNAGADALGTLEKSAPYVMESFIMDNQGAIVAATNKTSDYWQGDEDKFTESFKGGAGAIHTGEVEFDDSAQAYLVQVSVPVMSEGKAIGAITIGVDVGTWEQ